VLRTVASLPRLSSPSHLSELTTELMIWKVLVPKALVFLVIRYTSYFLILNVTYLPCCDLGGTLELWGESYGPTWTRLATTANAGATQLTLKVPNDLCTIDKCAHVRKFRNLFNGAKVRESLLPQLISIRALWLRSTIRFKPKKSMCNR
jgi:hypothetical protein